MTISGSKTLTINDFWDVFATQFMRLDNDFQNIWLPMCSSEKYQFTTCGNDILFRKKHLKGVIYHVIIVQLMCLKYQISLRKYIRAICMVFFLNNGTFFEVF